MSEDPSKWYVGTCCATPSGKKMSKRYSSESEARASMTKGMKVRRCTNSPGTWHVAPTKTKGSHHSKYKSETKPYRKTRTNPAPCCNSPRTAAYVKKLYSTREEAAEVAGEAMRVVRCKNNPGKYHVSGRRNSRG